MSDLDVKIINGYAVIDYTNYINSEPSRKITEDGQRIVKEVQNLIRDSGITFEVTKSPIQIKEEV